MSQDESKAAAPDAVELREQLLALQLRFSEFRGRL